MTVKQAGSGSTLVPKGMQSVAFVALMRLRRSDLMGLWGAMFVGTLAIAVF